MFQALAKRSGWTNTHQCLYSLIWSAFLDLDEHSARETYKRYRPYSIVLVLGTLLRDVWKKEEIDLDSFGAELFHPTVKLDPTFRELALWALTPSLFHETMSLGSTAPRVSREQRKIDEEKLGRVREVFRRYFRETFDVELASFRQSFESWPLLPPILAGEVRTAVTAARRSATANVTADVQLNYECLRRFVAPHTWNAFPHWNHAENGAGGDTLTMGLCLPGGRKISSKWRTMQGAFAVTGGSFESRLDYELTERPSNGPVHDADERASSGVGEHDRARDQKQLLPIYSPNRPQVATLRGYLSFAKIPARPGWTRVVAERTARFESPNHDRFRVETLLFWLAVEVLTIARTEPDAEPWSASAG